MKYSKKICPCCNKEVAINNFNRHVKSCNGTGPQVQNKETAYHVDHDGLECKFCGKLCKNLNSLTQHELRCSKNVDRKSFNYLGEWSHNNLKGETKYTKESIAKQANTFKEMYASGKYVSPMAGRPGTWLGKTHTEEQKEKIGRSVSKSRTDGYKNGTITPAKGVGRGKYSYIIYNDNEYMLRSTYEFIYALYLLDSGINFKLEDVRLPALTKNKYAKTFICDFHLYELNTIVEIKGIPSDKDKYIRETFESYGYKFIEYFESDILKIKQLLINKGYDMESLINEIAEGHATKNYFRYKYAPVMEVVDI